MELALRRLLQDGRIIQYGRSTRRLYAAPRPIHPALEALSSEAIRLLQLLPIEGAVPQSVFERGDASRSGLYSQIKSKIDPLSNAGLLIVARSSPRILMLSEMGREARSNLGTGLMVSTQDPLAILQLLETGQAHHLKTLRDRTRCFSSAI